MFATLLSLFVQNPDLAGWLLVTGLLFQVGLLVVGGARRLYTDTRYVRHQEERFALEVRAVQLRIESLEQAVTGWRGFRKFAVQQKVKESADTYSFHLRPHDGRPLPPFRPGQYLTFQLKVPGVEKPLLRCYSLSDRPHPDHYRVSIKRCAPPSGGGHPPGVASSYFCDLVQEGHLLDVKAPSGDFFLDLNVERPVVLIAGGIGVTPMISMAHALLAAGSPREVWFFFGARNRDDHPFKDTMAQLAARPQFHVHVCYSKPRATDVPGRDYQHEGRVTGQLLKALLPSHNFDYFLCGPGPFMQSITEDLRAWGVPDSWVHFEAFGPASIKRAPTPATEPAPSSEAGAADFEVAFAASNRRARWNGSSASLLDLAEQHGVRIDAGCRAGNCGSCRVGIMSGDVEYFGLHGAEPHDGSCLPCVCKPKGPLVVDA